MAVDKSQIVLNQDGTADWGMSFVGRDGTMWSGAFRFHVVVTPMQVIAADRDYRALLGQNPAFASDLAANLAFDLSQLRQRVISSPPWWSTGAGEFPGGQIEDREVISTVLDAAIGAQEKRREERAAEAAQRAEQIRRTLAEFAASQREEAKRDADEKTRETTMPEGR
jgi:hypothetical protein